MQNKKWSKWSLFVRIQHLLYLRRGQNYLIVVFYPPALLQTIWSSSYGCCFLNWGADYKSIVDDWVVYYFFWRYNVYMSMGYLLRNLLRNRFDKVDEVASWCEIMNLSLLSTSTLLCVPIGIVIADGSHSFPRKRGHVALLHKKIWFVYSLLPSFVQALWKLWVWAYLPQSVADDALIVFSVVSEASNISNRFWLLKC